MKVDDRDIGSDDISNYLEHKDEEPIVIFVAKLTFLISLFKLTVAITAPYKAANPNNISLEKRIFV